MGPERLVVEQSVDSIDRCLVTYNLLLYLLIPRSSPASCLSVGQLGGNKLEI